MGRPKQPKATRNLLLDAAFEQLYLHGFHGTSIQAILQQSGLTKGALFHHYASKKALALATLEQIITPLIYERWLEPLEQPGNPVDILQELFRNTEQRMMLGNLGERALLLGCPLGQLAQEMSPLDSDFRQGCEQVFTMWREGLSGVLEMGQQQRQVRTDIDSGAVARFLIAALEGSISMARQSATIDSARRTIRECSEHLVQHLEWLRY
ncbi:MAG: TetR/AcrR family transcriptional regulator [Mariprofundales bacterium]|nr:TetR/AcrR family transcriptional regulator [Mariprofundales bacterium]